MVETVGALVGILSALLVVMNLEDTFNLEPHVPNLIALIHKELFPMVVCYFRLTRNLSFPLKLRGKERVT
jgi:hypothetical protein